MAAMDNQRPREPWRGWMVVLPVATRCQRGWLSAELSSRAVPSELLAAPMVIRHATSQGCKSLPKDTTTEEAKPEPFLQPHHTHLS